MNDLTIRDAREQDAAACASIYNPYVRDTAITFEIDPVSDAEMAERIAHKAERHAFLVAEAGGRVVGYAYAGEYRDRYAWQWAAETSVYVDREAHRGGVGRGLYVALLDRLRGRGYRYAVGVIALPNDASVRLHQRLGFDDAGVLRRAGWKLGRWHDVATMQAFLGAATGDAAGPPSEPR